MMRQHGDEVESFSLIIVRVDIELLDHERGVVVDDDKDCDDHSDEVVVAAVVEDDLQIDQRVPNNRNEVSVIGMDAEAPLMMTIVDRRLT